MSAETLSMTKLMSLLRNSMNGAVVGSMEERGLSYGLSYGVAVHTIRDIARGFAPDHPLACLLYRQQVRELRIAATYIAEPALLTVPDLGFWAAGIGTAEIAEHTGRMIGRSDIVTEAVAAWGASGHQLEVYAALTAAAHGAVCGKLGTADFGTAADAVMCAAPMDGLFIRRAIVSLIEKAYRHIPDSRDGISALLARLYDMPDRNARETAAEAREMIEYIE